jgi:hypothetical protein
MNEARGLVRTTPDEDLSGDLVLRQRVGRQLQHCDVPARELLA